MLNLKKVDKVYIVSIHTFLSLYVKGKYGENTQHVKNGLIQYIDREKFLYKDPEDNALVIFDEIYQMVGSNSLYIEPDFTKSLSGNIYSVNYLPNVIKKWNSFICLSGTIEKDVHL